MPGQFRGDFTRLTFHPLKHFSRVLLQQGRVELDADWNEQVAILLRNLHALAADLIGRHGGPVDNCGFAIGPARQGDFVIGPGHYYVDGMLCELDTTVVALAAAASNATQVQVPSVVVDDVGFQKNQFVEVFPADPKDPPVISAEIADVKAEQRQLTLGPAVSGVALRRVVTYKTQPDYPAPDALPQNGTCRVYLDIWERHLSYVEDDTMREVALGGPDTAARSKLVWQVRVLDTAGGGLLPPFTPEGLAVTFQPDNRGRLKAMAKQESAPTSPCIMPPESRYRGAGNQLYRVEIHRGGSVGDEKKPTFKWSRENGSVVFPIVTLGASDGAAGATTVTLETLGRDDRSTLEAGDWVEIEDDDSALQPRAQTAPSSLLQVQSVDRTTMSVVLNGIVPGGVGRVPAKHPLLRRWDQKEGDDPEKGGLELQDDGAALIVEGVDKWLRLEDGVQIQFQPPDKAPPANRYRTGDYWLIPARTATGDVEWPATLDSQGNPIRLAVPPHGIEHHYAPLAVVTVAAGTVTNVENKRARFNTKALPF